MDSGPLVSFVVPSYNYGRFLRGCLDSVFRQEGRPDFEIVVVDDASTDGSQGIIRSIRDPRLRPFFHEKNQGHVVTINEGFQAARGRFIARIDSDDRYRPYYLSEVLDKLEKYPEVGLVYGDVAIIDETGSLLRETSDRIHGGKDFKGNEFLQLLESNFVPAPTVIARREAWAEALPIPAGLGFSDWYLTLRIARKHDFYYIHRPLADYRVHPENLHARMILDKSEEHTIFRILDEIFGEWKDGAGHRPVRDRVYGRNYLMLADKYFGSRMDADARRCYLEAIRRQPRYLLDPGVLRRLVGTGIGRERYEAIKRFLKGAGRLSP